MEQRKLSGWQDIAGHVNADVRTAQRWEAKRGMPVHRTTTGRVFAFSDELDAWKNSAPPETVEPPEPSVVSEGAEEPALPEFVASPDSHVHSKRIPLWPLWLPPLVIALIFGAVLFSRPEPAKTEALVSAPRRVLWKFNSGSASRVAAPFASPPNMVFTPDERYLYAITFDQPVLRFIDTESWATQSYELPIRPRCMRLAPDGHTLFIGSSRDGLLAFDIRTRRWQPPIATSGDVWDIAFPPDGKRVFLAVKNRGVVSLNLSNHRESLLTNWPFPAGLAVDPKRKRLFVSYRGGGPKGRRGHDSIEIFDLLSEASTGFLPSLPMVGSPLYVSPDNELLVFGSADACTNPKVYDGEGCPAPNSMAFHIVRLSTLEVIRSYPMPADSGAGMFLPNSQAMLFIGVANGRVGYRGIAVFDVQRFQMRERVSLPFDVYSFAVARNRNLVVASTENHGLLVLPTEPQECLQPFGPPIIQHTFDGIDEDLVSGGRLVPPESLRFAPGVVGQSLLLTPETRLRHSIWIDSFGAPESTMALYIKPSLAGQEQPVVKLPGRRYSWTLSVDADSHAAFRITTSTGEAAIRSRSPLPLQEWRHVVLTRDASGVRMYIDGIDQSSTGTTPIGEITNSTPIEIGGGFAGELDELMILPRTLTAPQIEQLYRSRNKGPCTVH